jgi:hypothetical protein
MLAVADISPEHALPALPARGLARLTYRHNGRPVLNSAEPGREAGPERVFQTTYNPLMLGGVFSTFRGASVAGNLVLKRF